MPGKLPSRGSCTDNGRILLAMYGPAADVKEKSPGERFGSDAVMYPAS
jgi:hypothetical protein